MVKHAEATTCTVEVAVATRRAQSDTFILKICDNGRGIARDARSGVGMHSMRERAEEIGGVLTVASDPVRGTTVCVELPVVHVEA